MTERIRQIYNEFQNFPPSGTIVRNGIMDDAYAIYVFETLFFPYHNIKVFSRDRSEDLSILIRSIVPPPDDGIDIFFEEDDFDQKRYHVVQVKNSSLNQQELEKEFLSMEVSIGSFFKNPKALKKNLKTVISQTEFSKSSICEFYVVHRGPIKAIRNQKPNFSILSFDELALIKEGLIKSSVPHATITIDKNNNFILNNFLEDDNERQSIQPHNIPKSLLCNFNGFDLAELNNQYASSQAGRNILFGQNLRESLGTKSKTFENMFSTINSKPELFLFYNNGITVLCSDVDAKTVGGKERITLKDFSIINGAQTTSTLGAYLKEAHANDDQDSIFKLKKVFVLTKIYVINSSLKEHESIGENIRIFTNTQTPLSNRDMVSIRSEQIEIQKRFIFEFKSPNVFIFIKNGEKAPVHPQFLPYQLITNERLAQLCFAGPLLDPFTAKDKRSKLFNVEQNEGVLLNILYDKIFNPKNGYLFRASNIELDELLFVYKLHQDCKTFHQQQLKQQNIKLTQEAATDDIDKKTREDRIKMVKRSLEISGVFIFHNICAYYLMKQQFDRTIKNSSQLTFNSKKYLNDKDFKQSLILSFYELTYLKSIDIISENSGIGNIQNWTRNSGDAEVFKTKFTEELSKREYKHSREYVEFISKSKVLVAIDN